LLPVASVKRWWIAGSYAPALLLSLSFYTALKLRTGFDFVAPTNRLGLAFRVWLVVAVVLSLLWQRRFLRAAPDKHEKAFHREMFSSLLGVTIWIVAAHVISESGVRMAWTTAASALALVPLVLLIRDVHQFNFLQIGRQRNLTYAVFSAF